MSDEAATAEATTETAAATTEQSESKTFTQDQVNALLANQKREVQGKFADYGDLKTKASEFDKLAESQKTELQKAIERADLAERALSEASSTNLRLAVIAKHGIPEDLQEFVIGSNEEELEARALKVLALVPAPVAATPNSLRELVVPGEGVAPDTALNSDGLKAALEAKLGIF